MSVCDECVRKGRCLYVPECFQVYNKPNGYDDNGNPIQYGFGGGSKPMENKIQMTEKQARVMLTIAGIISLDICLENLNEAGFICKSELEELVDKCEERYKEWVRANYYKKIDVTKTFYECIQALKKNHPEFK